MNRKMYQWKIFILWMTIMVEFSTTASNTTLTCFDTEIPCGNKYCYNPITHACVETGYNITCFNLCGNQCYDLTTQICLNNTVCLVGEDVCDLKYSDSGEFIALPEMKCYDPKSHRCLNHMFCYEKDRVCNNQCILNTLSNRKQVCANDNRTLCPVDQDYTYYKPNQIQVCNGECYDTQSNGSRHCVNGSIQCVSNCSNECYNASTNVCINGQLCKVGEDLCLTNYSSSGYAISPPKFVCYNPASFRCIDGMLCSFNQDTCLIKYDSTTGNLLSPSRLQCYDPLGYKCINNTFCPNTRICNKQCMTGVNVSYQVCANDRRTICNVSLPFNTYKHYQMHLCNGKCFDTSVQQCVNGTVTCIDTSCGNQCFDSAIHVCINSSICKIGQDLCEVKYDYFENSFQPSKLECYDPKSRRCLNHTFCYEKDRVCNDQCIPNTSSYRNRVCANDNRTLCSVNQDYTYYKPNQIQVCNGKCYDIESMPLQQCVNGVLQCVSICSNTCYDKGQYLCINDTLCSIGTELCVSGFNRQCYNPLTAKCVNGTVCANNRICGSQCISNDKQVCADDGHTICNVTKSYNNYKLNQIKLCRGVCYDSLLEQCSGEPVPVCIHDPAKKLPFHTSTPCLNSTLPLEDTNSTSPSSSTSTYTTSVTTEPSTSSESGSLATSTSNSELLNSTLPRDSTLSSTTTENNSATPHASTEASSNSQSHSPTRLTSTIEPVNATSLQDSTSPSTDTNSPLVTSNTKSSSQNTLSFTPIVPIEDSCCATKECTNKTNCCIPRVECLCHPRNTYLSISLPFCRRPIEPIILNRSNDTQHCYHNGTLYSFANLQKMNISISTVLHQWKSSIEKVEDYIRFLTNPIDEFNGYICKCINLQSFGKNCKYLLPIGRTLTDTFYAENNLKLNNSHYVQFYGDIICYRTLNYWSDEIQFYDDIKCSTDGIYIPCDDRICPPNQYSCGDGQCIIDRFDFQIISQFKSECQSKREQAFLCETHYINDMWTLPNGRCYEKYGYNQTKMSNLTVEDQCRFILLCDLSGAVHVDCPCGEENTFCTEQLTSICHSNSIQFSKIGIMAPYIFFFYPKYYKLRPDFLLINGTIKCHGILIDILAKTISFLTKLHQIENFICQWTQNKSLNNIDQIDEQTNISFSKISRYCFRCSSDEITCLSIILLGNSYSDCHNTFDEYWLGTSRKLSDMNCNYQKKDHCYLLRQYIEKSWFENEINQVSEQIHIPFRYYCDTFWNLPLRQDENVTECRQWWKCLDEQWQCDNGQCIDKKWLFDNQWDCADASDEKNSFNQLVPYSTLCNKTTEFACFTNQKKFSCINWSQIGNEIIDCYGAIDERNNILHCNQQTMLGYNYKCQSNKQCIPYWNHCFGERCKNSSDDDFWCNYRLNISFCERIYDAVCFNGNCIRNGRCNQIFDCDFGEDEYMCEYQHILQLTRFQYREEKEIIMKNSYKKFQLIQFPIDSNLTLSITSSISTTKPSTLSLNHTDPIAYWCNRGIGVYFHNRSIICFCPPQYYGDKCQYHSDRISLLFHLNLSESIYSMTNDINLVFKIVILFMFKNEILTNYFFHARVVSELLTYSKKFAHYLYSHSKQFLQYKFERYLNYSNDYPPYSIRIEMYEKSDFDQPKLFAVWKYPIYFDYLPVLRLTKILRFPKQEDNPCSSNPCHQNQVCQAILNEKSQYICLCKANFTGENCSLKDEQCLNGYCSYGSLCQPGYRGLLIGNHLPYCICSFNRYGERCFIEHDRCQSNPCLNNGSCFSTSKPESSACICTDKYHGNKCQFRKPETKLFINETMNHLAAVVQYFDIDFISLNLNLVYQKIYRILPNSIEYEHQHGTIPEIVVVKLYSEKILPELYVISVQIDIQSIDGITQLNDETRLLNENKESVIGPGITLVPQLFSLPLFIIPFTLYCQNLENSWIRYLLIVSYFFSFLPQLTSFLLYVLPSSFYSTEWYATSIGRWVSNFVGFKPSISSIAITSTRTD
ncbi:hypothetical protein I4U23_005224 [Adineta vaga]|nr:hypothetical protein I4U23_005224 [Adineta vaga]